MAVTALLQQSEDKLIRQAYQRRRDEIYFHKKEIADNVLIAEQANRRAEQANRRAEEANRRTEQANRETEQAKAKIEILLRRIAELEAK